MSDDIHDDVYSSLDQTEVAALVEFAKADHKNRKKLSLDEMSAMQDNVFKEMGIYTTTVKPLHPRIRGLKAQSSNDAYIQKTPKRSENVQTFDKTTEPNVGEPAHLEKRTDQEPDRTQVTGNQSTQDRDSIEIDKLIELLTTNKEEILDLSNNHISYSIANKLFAFVASDRCTLRSLVLANCNLNDIYVDELVDCLTKNKTLVCLNIETNSFTGSGLTRIFKCFSDPARNLSNLKVANQSTSMGSAAEEALIDMLKSNRNIINVCYDSKNKIKINTINKYLMQNLDQVRIHKNLAKGR